MYCVIYVHNNNYVENILKFNDELYCAGVSIMLCMAV